MYKSHFFIILFSIGLFSYSQNATQAKALLDEVYDKVTSYESMYIAFSANLENAEANLKQESQGEITLSGDKYLLDYLGAKQLYDGEKIYTIIPENQEITIDAYTEEENPMSPSKMLTFYSSGHTYAWDILQNISGRRIQYVKVTPIDAQAAFKSILLGIDMATKHIYKLIQTGSNGTKTIITLRTFTPDLPVPETFFTFDEQEYRDKGYYIIKN